MAILRGLFHLPDLPTFCSTGRELPVVGAVLADGDDPREATLRERLAGSVFFPRRLGGVGDEFDTEQGLLPRFARSDGVDRRFQRRRYGPAQRRRLCFWSGGVRFFAVATRQLVEFCSQPGVAVRLCIFGVEHERRSKRRISGSSTSPVHSSPPANRQQDGGRNILPILEVEGEGFVIKNVCEDVVDHF